MVTRRKLKREIEALEHTIAYVRKERNKEARRWHAALNLLCANCDIYRHYEMQVYKRCDARNCPIYNKVVLLSDD